MWTYHQSSGLLSRDGEALGTGYSGMGDGKNNPQMEAVHDVGPLPAGNYQIGPAHDTLAFGPHVMALTPSPGNEMFGRAGFLIHADSISHPGRASHGCIVLPLSLRQKISASGDHHLQVVA
jgi:hypothetical protein